MSRITGTGHVTNEENSYECKQNKSHIFDSERERFFNSRTSNVERRLGILTLTAYIEGKGNRSIQSVTSVTGFVNG